MTDMDLYVVMLECSEKAFRILDVESSGQKMTMDDLKKACALLSLAGSAALQMQNRIQGFRQPEPSYV